MDKPTPASVVSTPRIAIIGNPNVGKSTIFNQLTGLSQKIGNYPGVTVDKKVGVMNYQGNSYQIIDLPGTYSLYPNSEDEIIANRVLSQTNLAEKPEFVLMVIDSSQLSRGLFLATQLIDLGLSIAIVLNMADIATKRNIAIKTFEIFKALGVPILSTDARGEKGLDQIRDLIHTRNFSKKGSFIAIDEVVPTSLLDEVQSKFDLPNQYQAYQMLRFGRVDKVIPQENRDWIKSKLESMNFDLAAAQLEETKIRYRKITKIVEAAVVKEIPDGKVKSGLDGIFLHPVFGYVIFAAILLLIFQAIFAWATVPMDLIDGFFAELSGRVSDLLPAGPISSLISEGIIPGIGGVVIFIPQIAMLFGFLAILEDTGYMSRVVFLMDRWMRPYGLHGKSVVPLISGVACAIPGVMAARNIGNWKEKIITIMVTPLMSCSARLPVYVILIGLVVPDKHLGFINLQALTLLGLYFLGIIGVLGTAFLLKNMLKTTEKSFLMVELPSYRAPRWWDVVITMYNKSKTFVLEAGKVILAISVILWVLASYGPPSRMDEIRTTGEEKFAVATNPEQEEQILAETSSLLLENSFIGIMGRGIEPVIRPLGYDWKIGIALIASFAAREVFVSTIATIYSIGGDPENDLTIRQKLNQQVRPNGDKVYNTATAFSLMVFYAFAMQCMSTVAVVYRETKSWKWPLIQTAYMTGLAYLSAFIVYQILS